MAIGDVLPWVKNQFVNLTAPPSTAGLPYDLQLQMLKRQQDQATADRASLDDPIPIQSSGGIQAPIPWTAILAKALQGVGANVEQGRVDKQMAGIGQQQSSELADYLQKMGGTPTTVAPGQGQNVQLPQAQMPNGQPPVDLGTISSATPGFSYNQQPTAQEKLALSLQALQGGPTMKAAGELYGKQAADEVADQQKQARLATQYANAPDPTQDPAAYRAWLAQADPAAAAKLGSAIVQENAKPPTPSLERDFTTDYLKKNPSASLLDAHTAWEKAGFKPPDPSVGWQVAYDPTNNNLPFRFNVRNGQATTMDNQPYKPGGYIKPSAANSLPADQPIAIDPTSPSLNAQTGLSQLALDRILGAPNQPRGGPIVAKIDKELSDYSVNNRVNMTTLRSKAEGINKVITQNTIRNNQANILENEITGSVQTLTPILDQMKASRVNLGNVASILAGKQVNDPAAIQAADQISRFRKELAGYNAVAGGHLLENGTPNPSPSDYEDATHTILGGINQGGARAVAQSTMASAKKNRAVLDNAMDDANQELWTALGVGKNYKRTAAPLASLAAPSKPAGNGLSQADRDLINKHKGG